MEEVLDKAYVGRLAPSPTGALHLGNVRTFMIAYLRARSLDGRLILRMEDLDHPKDKPGAAAQAIEDLRWLGFDWDDEFVQSERKPLYRSALEKLVSLGLAYPCVCSRKDVESAQSAPHSGEQLHYPGTCRDRFASWREAYAFLNPSNSSLQLSPLPSNSNSNSNSHLPLPRTPCWRFRVDGDPVVLFDDVFAGTFRQRVAESLGDFPIARDEFGAGYTLAVVVDDAAMGVTEVIRGDDLLAATPAQIMLQRALGLPTPSYCHVPLVVGPDGRRLAKRHGDTRISSYREAGIPPERIIGFLAASCGWAAPGEHVSLADLVPRFSLSTLPHSPLVLRGSDGIWYNASK